MALSNTSSLYGGVTKTFHWLTALLIFTAFPLGVIAVNLPFGTDAELQQKAWLFSLHKTVGVSIFFVALVRILWALGQPRPVPLHPERRIETFLAQLVHWMLYASLVLVPLSGWLHHAATDGFAPILWPLGQSLPIVPKDPAVAHFFQGWHFALTKVLLASVLLHVAGAMKHVIVDRDLTMRRMLPGTCPEPKSQADSHGRAPLAAAVGLYVVALAAGSAIGLGGDAERSHADLETVDSEWTVIDGSMGISVKQLGSDVAGRFEDWTASISFDPDIEDEIKGSVEVTIGIGSLSLGAVTQQAMGPEFFDVAAFPTARYQATLTETEGTYVSRGSLEIKGISVPVDFPFLFEIVDGQASMSGEVLLDRRDYDIGTVSYQDESSLGFPVTVSLSVTAVRE